MAKYIFHSEKTKTTCKECLKHDGKVFYDIKDIPQLPIHPNCKCWIETVEDKSDKKECDCKDRTQVLKNNLSNIIENTKTMQKSLSSELLECAIALENPAYQNYSSNFQTTQEKLLSFKDKLSTLIKSTKDLFTDIEILKEQTFDPTYHTKSQCHMTSGLNKYADLTTSLCERLNKLAEEFKSIKEERRTLSKNAKNAKESEEKEIRERNEKEKDFTKLSSTEQLRQANAIKMEMGTKTNIAMAENAAHAKKEIVNGLANKKKEIENNFKKGGREFVNSIAEIGGMATIGENYDEDWHNYAKNKCGKDTAGMLDLAHGAKINDKSYIDDVYHLKNWNDPAVASDKEYLKDKVKKGFDNYGFDIDKIKGYFFKSNSEPVQRLVQNKDFKNIIRAHKKDILIGKDFSDGFPLHDSAFNIESNFKNAIGRADFRHPWIDSQGNLHIKMYDTYDFNEGENGLVKAGRYHMQKGNLKPFFTIHDIIVPKAILDSIWK